MAETFGVQELNTLDSPDHESLDVSLNTHPFDLFP